MEFSIEVAKVFAKKNCKDCWGRGYLTRQVSPDKFPLVNEFIKVNYNGEIVKISRPNVNKPIESTNFCHCAERSIKRLENG